MKNTLKWVGIIVVTAAALSATACNTIQGAGQDIGSAGEKVEDITKKS